LLDESRGLSAGEVEGVKRVLLVVIAEPDRDIPAVRDIEGHVAEDREAFLMVELAAVMSGTRTVEPDDSREERDPRVECIAGPRPAVDAVRVQGRIDRGVMVVRSEEPAA